MNDISKIIADKILWNSIDKQSEMVLQQWLELSAENRETFERAKKGELAAIILQKENDDFGKKVSQKVLLKISVAKKQNANRRRFFSISVAALVVISFLIFLKKGNIENQVKEQLVATKLEADDENDKVRLITTDGNSVDIEKSEMLDSIVKQSTKAKDFTELKAAIVTNTLVVPHKKSFNMVLPDGTKVWLNAGSKLIFPSQFSDTLRSVELIGEAFFDVVKSTKVPFLVKTKTLRTKVVGTKFMVTSYEDNFLSEVALVEGCVNVSSTVARKNTTLNAGEGILYDSEDNCYKKIDINIDEIINRTGELFIFNDISLFNITKLLSRWYGVEFEFSDAAIQEEIFYLKSMKYDKIEEIMTLLKDTKKIDFSIKENKIKIKSLMK